MTKNALDPCFDAGRCKYHWPNLGLSVEVEGDFDSSGKERLVQRPQETEVLRWVKESVVAWRRAKKPGGWFLSRHLSNKAKRVWVLGNPLGSRFVAFYGKDPLDSELLKKEGLTRGTIPSQFKARRRTSSKAKPVAVPKPKKKFTGSLLFRERRWKRFGKPAAASALSERLLFWGSSTLLWLSWWWF